MTPKCWIARVLLTGIFLVYLDLGALERNEKKNNLAGLKKKFTEGWTTYIAAENFTCLIKKQKSHPTLVFLKEGAEDKLNLLPQLRTNGASHFLYFKKWLTKMNVTIYVLQRNRCNDTFQKLAGAFNQSTANRYSTCDFNQNDTETCQVRCFNLKTICNHNSYDEQNCNKLGKNVKNWYVINTTAAEGNCYNCDNPVKKPDVTISLRTSPTTVGETIEPTQAVKLMNGMSELVLSLDESSAELSGGDGVTGIIMTQSEPAEVEEVTFGYASPNASLSMLIGNHVNPFPRSIKVSKEAFEKAFNPNVSLVFAAVLRFTNFAQDKLNRPVLGDEVLAVDMGTNVTNLTDKINIHFEDVTYDGIPSCRSWNGEGASPDWTDDGCETVIDENNNIMCQCSHLTFFAILLIPLNETISSSDLNNLTIITQVGCGLSMFFLAIALFMHFLLRRTRATNTTKILIHLVSVMFLLNFTFLVNSHVARMKSSVGCKIMAALMHYFMLATFTWFAAQAFHLCLQMYRNGKILIHHYVLKVSVTSWGIPCVVVIVLLSVGKYGEQVIHSDGTNNVTMCWIADGQVHYIVNIGYYALIFLFTFSTFIITLTWFHCLKRSKSGSTQLKSNGINIMTVMGLCCLLGITWGFAFFAYGVLRIPSYYIFTVLNSFQGFFLFIYYYSNNRETSTSPSDGVSSNSSGSSTTATTIGKDLILENPYCNLHEKKHQE